MNPNPKTTQLRIACECAQEQVEKLHDNAQTEIERIKWKWHNTPAAVHHLTKHLPTSDLNKMRAAKAELAKAEDALGKAAKLMREISA